MGLKQGSAQYFYRKDAQGIIIANLDSVGNAVVKYEYDAPETINGLNLYAYCNNDPVMNKQRVELNELAELPANLKTHYFPI